MHSRTKTIISVIIVIFMFSILFVPGQSVKAEENQGSPSIHLTGSWVNPYYVDIQSQPVNSMYPMDVAITYSAANETELRSVIHQAFTNRETYPQITYTGASADLGDVDEFGYLLNVDGLSSLIQSTINADDYLKFNIVYYPYCLSQGEASCVISFIDNKDPLNPKYVSYLTTLAEENYVDEAVTGILSAIIEPGMNPHQKVKAIHDYIVLNVAYDTTLEKHSAYAALYGEKKTVCQGYALLAYKMLTEEGIEARIIDGKAGTASDPALWEDHAWTRVLLDDKWYNLDCTWDDPIPDEPGRVIYPYYLLIDTEIAVNHLNDLEYATLPPANNDYLLTLKNLIELNNEQSEIYKHLHRQMGFDYFLTENTAETAEQLENKIMTSFQQKDSQSKVRYNANEDSNPMTTVSEIMGRRPAGTGVSGGTGAPYDRGLAMGYWLIELDLIYSVPNQPPVASSVTINGYANVAQTLTGTYAYADEEGDAEGLSQYQWYRCDNSDGTGNTEIPGAIGSQYTVNTRDSGKYLFFEVVPAASTGTLQGAIVLSAASAAVGPVLEKAASPTSTVPAGAVESGTTVTLNTATPGASIYYTLNESAPTPENGILYDGNPIMIDAAKTIKAITVKEGMIDSEVAEFAYTIAGVDDCFIATAAFGSKFDWPVALLRAFRDQYLLTNKVGTAFVDFYYNNSPPIATFIAQSESLRALVRVMLAPVIAVVYFIYHPTMLVIFLILVLGARCLKLIGAEH